MTRPKVCIFNVETQEEIVREMNDVEYEQHLIDKAQGEAAQAELDAKKAAKAQALAALGLSQEVVNLLAE
jgi:hypothetical protein